MQAIRQFFDEQGVLEVQTPILLNYPTTDVYIDSISMLINQAIKAKSQYLHTSPELEMKKLLAGGSGDIYQICPVFRDNEQGKHNANEFTLLEYYRLDFDIHQLMDEIIKLLTTLGIRGRVTKLSYAQAFFEYADIDILNSDLQTLKKIAKSHQLSADFQYIEDLQMLLFVHLIEPKLTTLPLCFIYNYPSAQCALAKIDGNVAYRFELYLSGIEVANGYDELQRLKSYQQYFENEIEKRVVLGKKSVALDQDFLTHIQNTLPQCAGVAIGIDRLLAQL